MTEEIQGTKDEQALLAFWKEDAKVFNSHLRKSEALVNDRDDDGPPTFGAANHSARRAPTYKDGKPCRCGGTLRFTRDNRCVTCRSLPPRREASVTTYEGAPCNGCGAKLRYIKSNNCVACGKASTARSIKRANGEDIPHKRRQAAKLRGIVSRIRAKVRAKKSAA